MFSGVKYYLLLPEEYHFTYLLAFVKNICNIAAYRVFYNQIIIKFFMENKRKADPNAQTLIQPAISTPEKALKPVSTSSALAVDHKAVEVRRSSTAGKLMLFLAGIGLGAAGGSAGTSYMLKNSNHAAQKPVNSAAAPLDSGLPAGLFKTRPAVPNDAPGVMPDAADFADTPSSQPATPDTVEMPDTPEKLARIITDFKISVKAEDFQANGLKDRFMRILMLENKANDDGSGSKMGWVPIPSIIKEDDILIAIRVDKPEYRSLLVFPGRAPISKVEDKNDPQIVYAYYHCINSDNTQNRGASAAVLYPGSETKPPTKRFRTRTYLISKGFTLPKCGKE